MLCNFSNDNNVSLELINHSFSNTFAVRTHHEVQFRRIHTYLINKQIIKNNIIDLGAWIGDNTIPWAKNLNGIVYSIDPSSENCDFISEMCKTNKINNVRIIKSAISDKNEVLSTHDHINHCSFSNATLENALHVVDAVSLDYLCDIRILDNIGYIHLDVEGMEMKVINGSVNLIDKYRPIISFEQHLEIDKYDDILNFFTKKNYKVFLIDEILPGCRIDCRNSLAFPNEIYNESVINDINILMGNILIPKYDIQIEYSLS